MPDPASNNQILYVTNFHDLVSTPFEGTINAICWRRQLAGDFSEIVDQTNMDGTMAALGEDQLLKFDLSGRGEIAREVLMSDMKLLKEHGASPVLNVIEQYERDDAFPFFPTDVYSFHVDRSPVPTDTFLCTYVGEPSDIVPNTQATQKILIPEIRHALKKMYNGADEAFDRFLSDHFFDLHYEVNPNAETFSLGIGHLWRLAVDHPESNVLACIHRAPIEKNKEKRLLLIC